MIRLQEFTANDFQRLIGWIPSEEQLYQFAGMVFKYPLDHQQLAGYLESTTRKVFKVVLAEGDIPVGHAEIGNINHYNKSASLCRILIGEVQYRKKGIGQVVVSELLKICFNDLNLHRVDLWVYDFNTSAFNCYKKCGFVIEGLARDAHKVNTNYWSAYLMSVLKPEWEMKQPLRSAPVPK